MFAELSNDLRVLGVAAGDLVMVHASLRRLGVASMPRGAETLLDALEAAVGDGGTLLMVLGTLSPHDWVNERPVERRAELLRDVEPLDFRTAPVLPEVGCFAEVFRRRDGTRVSDNPSGRFAARGRRADELLRNQPWNDYYGPGSPLEKLCEWGGKILRLGADPDTVTALHYAEYLARVPDKRRVRWDYVIADEKGLPRHVFIECLDDSSGIAPWSGEDCFAIILGAYLATGRARQGKVGRADSELIDAADLVRFGAVWMEEHLGPTAHALR